MRSESAKVLSFISQLEGLIVALGALREKRNRLGDERGVARAEVAIARAEALRAELRDQLLEEAKR